MSTSSPEQARGSAPLLSVGAVTARVVSDGVFDYDVDFLFPHVPEGALRSELAGRLNADGTLPVPWNCMLLTTPTATVLVDAGGGPRTVELGAGRLLARLSDAGVRPEDVDVVVVTHAHPDHIGGLVADGRPVFARARHVLSRVEWDTWTSEEVLAALPDLLAEPARAVLPVLERAGVLDLVEGETEVVPGVHLLPAPGHTPGHCAVSVRDGDDQLLHLVDSVLDAVHFTHPEWTAVPEMDPEQTVRTRRRLLDMAAADGIPVLGYHFSGIGRVERDDGAFALAR